MNTQIVFTLSDIGKFALWAAFLVILLYFIFILRRIYIALKDLTKVVEENRTQIDSILKSAPGITKNFEQISKDLSSDISAFNGTVSNLASITEKITSIKNLKEKFSKEDSKEKETNIE
ncbi:MAG: hypothetical protein JW702_00675 [Clostridiales bacterium]|nr:hypothetical protein [Clostridiales bacterium]